MKYIKTLETINNVMNPAALFAEDHASGQKAIRMYEKGYLIIADTMEYIITLSQKRKETM